MTLDFDAPLRPIECKDPNLDEREKPRLTRQSLAILGILRRGPVSNMELVKVATRFGARIYDLRKAGFEIEISDRDHETGLVIYTLVREAS